MNPQGITPRPEPEWMSKFQLPNEEKLVGHENIDNDDLRKQLNSQRNYVRSKSHGGN